MEIHIISGFLGSGKTTFINHYVPFLEGKIAIIENEFGSVGLDGRLIQAGDIPLREINSGCVCCSLRGNFESTIVELCQEIQPDFILIEPSGIAQLSEIIKACRNVERLVPGTIIIGRLITLVDVQSFQDYHESFGPFYADQIENAKLILLSNLDGFSDNERNKVISKLQKINRNAVLYNGDWRLLENRDLDILLRESDKVPQFETSESTKNEPGNRIFESRNFEDLLPVTEDQIRDMLDNLSQQKFGKVLRAKGIIPGISGKPYKVDYTPYQSHVVAFEDYLSPALIFIGINLSESLSQMLKDREFIPY